MGLEILAFERNGIKKSPFICRLTSQNLQTDLHRSYVTIILIVMKIRSLHISLVVFAGVSW